MTACYSLKFIQDLEATLSQAEAIAEIKKMKLAMTPRVPQLHNRTLSGNIFDQSLGILQDSILDGNGITTELLDSEHAHLEIIGNQVSISSEVHSAEEDNSSHVANRDDGEIGKDFLSLEGDAVNGIPEDTPGVGMEVVCSEGCESSSLSIMQSTVIPHSEEDPDCSVMVVQSIISPCTDGIPNGFEISLPHTESSKPGFSEEEMDHGCDRLVNKALTLMESKNQDSDSEGEMHYKIMQLLQEAPYELRYPVQRYSNQASHAPGKKRVPQSRKSNGRNIAPSDGKPPRKKRGRPRKHPITPSTSMTPGSSTTRRVSNVLTSITSLTASSLTGDHSFQLSSSLPPESTVAPLNMAEVSSPVLAALLRQPDTGEVRTSGTNGMEWRQAASGKKRTSHVLSPSGEGGGGGGGVFALPHSSHSTPVALGGAGKDRLLSSGPNHVDSSHMPVEFPHVTPGPSSLPKNDVILANWGNPLSSGKSGLYPPNHDDPT